MPKNYDFSGYATKNDLQCADGRTIRRNAFKECDGKIVPLVWMHQHDNPENVLGHALLENREDGVYTYGKFNNSEAGKTAKLLVEHGDVTSLSIYANQLKQSGGDVLHGTIREVSLVLAGANIGAYIDTPVLAHGEEAVDEAIIYADEKDADLKMGIEEEPEDMKTDEEVIQHAEEETGKKNKTIGEVVETMNDEQKAALYQLVGQVLEDSEDDTDDEEDEGEEEEMKHNVFDSVEETQENTLSHDAMDTIFRDAKKFGSLRESVLAHAQDYGIKDIDYLFPDAKSLNTPPDFIKREMDWVSVVMNGTHHTPFSRIKSMFANITEDAARAKGYIKGHLKKNEVFSLLKRTTDPQTIYKKQKLDRDDIIDITDFDVVAWLKAEMRMMLDEEIARAVLIGDGRLDSDDDHISHEHIRPIWTDAELYTVEALVNEGEDLAETAKNFIKAAIRARKDYKGSGNPILFTTEEMLTEMLLLEDGIGHTLYADEAQLAKTLRVNRIVTVPVMENQTRTVSNVVRTLGGIIVNLKDYNIGADKGGSISMFEDFDIDYNQQKYLIETRCSGALIKPYSAIVLEVVGA